MYQAFFPALRKHVRANGGSKEDAEDVFQDTIVVIFRKLESPEFSLRSSFGTYVFAIGKRVWLHKISRRSKRPQTSLEDAAILQSESPDLQVERTEKYRFFREKLKQLGEGCQHVLKLFFAGESMADIAKKMGFASEGYAKKRKFHCKQQLTKLVKADPRFRELTGTTNPSAYG